MSTAPLPVRSLAAAPARAVEIAAMLGDSVISVKHCLDPRGGRVARSTWAILAGGAACLVIAALTFAAALDTAGDNRAAFDIWTRVEHHPAFAFRPAQLPPGFDWLVCGGLAFGITGIAFGLVRLRAQRTSPFFRIGTAPGVDLPLSLTDAPATAFPLIAPSGDGFALTLGDGISGEWVADGATMPLRELARGNARPSRHAAGAVEVPIPTGVRIRARAGQATLIISAIDRPRAPALASAFDHRVLRYLAGSLAAHLALWGLLQLIAPAQMLANEDTSLLEDVGISARLTRMNDLPPVPSDGTGSASETDSSVRSPDSQSMVLSAGTAPSAHSAESGGASRGPAQSHDEAVAEARYSGFLGSDLLADGSDTARMASDFTGGFSDGSGPIYAAGDYRGFGTSRGSYAGCDDGEPCGPGGPGGIASGRYATIHTGPRAGDNFGIPGSGGPGWPAHHPDPPRLSNPILSGATYDKGIVRRYIHQHIDEIAYCYDKQLLAHPGISGEIVVHFLISPTGSVQGASGSGFDREIASCVADSVAHIAFPPPGEGGVQVSYPFQFHTAGQ